ncbi:TetR/AcrR family transcriptional regulator [uncultured Brevundimonas sp.]|uniref:TetR/AcrR family transcriptional regulator n=1 Tax=uncultured Brevundimonas sp. TaxID=213418 RepID=UPI00261ADD18|nr:TetR/AcrR family transcriptional regulator [uncultured Brevundimonas sp.]
MLPPGQPKFRRRAADRPAEILAAALEVFAMRGFAAARLDEVARLAGVSKGALYLYFETKDELFRAVVADLIAPNLERVRAAALNAGAPFETVARGAVALMAAVVAGDRRFAGVAKLVIAESRNRPELAVVWHANMVGPGLEMMSGLIRRAQTAGEVRPGDPRHFAMGLVGPVLLGAMWRETFEPIGAEAVDIVALANQHLDTVLRGMRP